MGARPTIVIAGAGIGGLTAALAVARAGWTAILVERSPALLEIGAGIQLSPNAVRVLARLGLEAAIAGAATSPASIDVRSGTTGRRLLSLPTADFAARYGHPYRVIHRAELQAVLVEAVGRNADVRLLLGAEVDAVLPGRDSLSIRIRHGDGHEIATADALIGADGVWSETRARLIGAAKATPTGRTAWRTVIPIDKAGGAGRSVRLWLGPGAHVVAYPIARGGALNVVAIVEEPLDEPGWAAHARDGRISERFHGWSREIRTIVDAAASWQRFGIHVVDPSGPWVAGRTALLGDAAHAMAPFLAQGAAMAIEDAAVLAARLSAQRDDVPAALAAYEAERKPRVARVWTAAAKTGRLYHETGLTGLARDLALRAVGRTLVLRRNDWIYGWAPPPSH